MFVNIVRQKQSIRIRFCTTKLPDKNCEIVPKPLDENCDKMTKLRSHIQKSMTWKVLRDIRNSEIAQVGVYANGIGMPILYLLENPPTGILFGSITIVFVAFFGCIIGEIFPPTILILIFIWMIIGVSQIPKYDSKYDMY